MFCIGTEVDSHEMDEVWSCHLPASEPNIIPSPRTQLLYIFSFAIKLHHAPFSIMCPRKHDIVCKVNARQTVLYIVGYVVCFLLNLFVHIQY